jgi:bifunctional non-homologous end joining protein LigD
MGKFIVHEHHARHLHFDFRLEMEGVLKSWAVPKGPSMNPSDKRLAIMVDDHTLEYGSFEGVIPEGHYGAGTVVIWDKGEFEMLRGGIREGRLEFSLKGKKLKGIFAMARMSGKDKEWLLMKKKDASAKDDFKLKTVLTPSLLKKLTKKVYAGESSQS